jgi:peptidoglycan-associated lipoprotein
MKSSNFRKLALLAGLIGFCGFVGGCGKKVASQAPASTPAPTAVQPTVTLNASPTTVKAGETVTLSWTSTNATDLDIQPEVGRVAPEGKTPVQPSSSTTYVITATGPGGTANANVRVTVTSAAVVEQPKGQPGVNELFEQNVKDAFFDFNKADIREDARQALTRTAEFLRSYPQVKVTIEGHCDERGSTEYNLGLGERRAQAAKNYLISLGITAGRMETVSWGKERPFCSEHTEDCWQQNRRAHFVMAH